MSRDTRIRKSADSTRSSRTEEENLQKLENEKEILHSQQGSGEMFASEFEFEALPDPNRSGDPSLHYFWATTTNPQDTPYRRMRMGYQLVKSEERPEYGHLRLKSGEFEGVISMNEMILMSIPMERYQKMMKYMHHIRPNEEAARLKANAKLGHVDKNGNPLDVSLPEDEGYRDLDRFPREPTTFE
jgi:hypothetical protein